MTIVRYLRPRAARVWFAAALIGASSCQRAPQPRGVQGEMRDIYGASKELSQLLLEPERFESPRSHDRVLALLDRLSSDFHNVERDAPVSSFEPGFRVVLMSQRALLRDARDRFAAGHKDYAQWRLRGLLSNCVACHTRQQVPADFVASSRADAATIEDSLAAADLLAASRQFEDASSAYMKVVRAALAGKASPSLGTEAMKSWLVIQVRAKSRLSTAADEIDEALLAFAKIRSDGPEELRSAMRNWAADLRALQSFRWGNRPVDEAHRMMGEVLRENRRDVDSAKLPSTLLASAKLHELLEAGGLTQDQRRRATYLLAEAYLHLPVRSLEVFSELYLEQCIREFPGSNEAQWCYADLNSLIERESTGSGGTQIPPETERRLRELRGLAGGGQEPAETIL